MKEKWLICGSRINFKNKINRKDYEKTVNANLTQFYNDTKFAVENGFDHEKFELELMHGNCPDCADEFAEMWINNSDESITIKRFPAKQGGYLYRNILMIKQNPDLVIAFWDGYSYGTAHTIAWAVKMDIRIIIIDIAKERKNGK